MKTLKLLALGLIVCFVSTLRAQTAEEIIENYIENIGGQKAWSKINSMEVTGIGRQQAVDYPFVATYMKDGRRIVNVNLQGNSFIFDAFDGESAWAMNFNTQKAEALDAETSLNTKNNATDYLPDGFMNYKEKGYSVELLGKEAFEGTECFKIKLIKKPYLVDGKEDENSETYYFDTESFVPIAMESIVKSGPGKGATMQIVFSDYQEVGGLYIPFSQIQKFNGQTGLELTYKSVVFNSDIDETIFNMPVDTTIEKN
jgi:outer membrane lipoprotein-sorting protein